MRSGVAVEEAGSSRMPLELGMNNFVTEYSTCSIITCQLQ